MEKIELRSEKIRRAIDQKPGFWLTWGTSIIAVALAAAVAIYFAN